MAAQAGEGDSMIASARRQRLYQNLASTFIALALGAQAASLGVTLVHPGLLLGRLYPIIEYPMYSDAHYDGERVTARWLLRGVLANGGEIDITEQSLGMSVWNFILLTDQVATGKTNSPQTRDAIQTLLAVVRSREARAHELKSLRIDSYPMKVTRHGAEVIASEPVLTLPMS
jgi:hypothetical protein